MRIRSGHMVFEEDFHYSDMEEVFPRLMDQFLEETGMMPDEEVHDIYLRVNMRDIVRDRKPEGINRKGRFKLIFPIVAEGERKEMYVRGSTKVTEVKRIVELLSDTLREAGIKHELAWDKLDTFYKERKV